VQIDAFILQGSPKPLNHAAVNPAPFTIDANLDFASVSTPIKAATCKLAALIGVENLWRAVFGQRLFQGLDTEVRVHAV
jgi:hypothetical protein